MNFVKKGGSIEYVLPDTGVASTRFWAKFGCDSTGSNCSIGDQVPNPITKDCPAGGCSAPIDTLFEGNTQSITMNK